LSVRSIIRKRLRRTRPNVHKGDFGRVFIIAGSRGLTGACRLVSTAALRSGAGLVTVGAPKSLANILARDSREAMWITLPETASGSVGLKALPRASSFLKHEDVLAIGPGLSRHPSTLSFVRALTKQSRKPMVIDADAIIAFQGQSRLLGQLKAPSVLTPHAGEFQRIFGEMPVTETDRLRAAEKAAKEFGVVVVLKGHRTVVANPRGQTYVNLTGNPGMATGGMGDVLTGMIAAFIGQKMDVFEAASSAVYIHGLAGDYAAKKIGEVSLLPSGLLNEIPYVIKKIVGK